MTGPTSLRTEAGSAPRNQEPRAGWKYRQLSHDTIPSYSLIFVLGEDGRELLLGYKKRGFGAGLYNGFGGKPDPGETMKDCAIRELEEESGLVTTHEEIEMVGEMLISRPDRESLSLMTVIRIHVFICRAWLNDPIETEEMSPKWITMLAQDSSMGLPLSQMWPEAGIFIPPLLRSAIHRTKPTLTAYIEYQMVAPETVEPWQIVPLSRHQGAHDQDVEALSGWQIDV